MKTGELIGIMAKDQGISLRQLAINAGIPYNTLYAIVKRKSTRIEPDTLQAIADALGVTLAELTNLQIQYDSSGKIVSASGYAEDLKQFLGMDESKDEEKELVTYFQMLNNDGQQKAVERVKELTEIPRYQKEKTPADGD